MQKDTNRIMDMVIKNKDKYQIVVDNDSVWVIDKETEEEVETFSEYGYHLLIEVFKYLKLDADYC